MEYRPLEYRIRSVKPLVMALNLLDEEDDTKCLSGLFLLKTILDNSPRVQLDPDVIARCWTAIPSNFLDRLFQTQAQASNQDKHGKEMFGLAVAIVHAFIALLPDDRFSVLLPRAVSARMGLSWKKRLGSMMAGLSHSQPEVLLQIVQILEVFSYRPGGAILLVGVKDWTPLLRLTREDGKARDIFLNTMTTLAQAAAKNIPVPTTRISELLEYSMSTIVPLFKNDENIDNLFIMVNELFELLPPDFFVPRPTWLQGLTELVHGCSNSRHKAEFVKVAQAVRMLSARLLQTYPLTFPTFLFDPTPKKNESSNSKPLSYLFIKLVTVDIASTIPSLQETLKSPGYLETSSRLEACYTILTSFINFLVNTLGEDDEDDEDVGSVTEQFQRISLLQPDILLRLRADICQVLSLTIEYLRDRHDISSEGMAKDKLTGAQIRTLSLWLRDDDGGNLRNEAAGITDVLLSLYNTTKDGSNLDYKDPVAIILEATCATSDGIHAFLSQNGWEILTKDLEAMAHPDGKDEHRYLGISIIRALLAVVHSDEAGPAKAGWMPILEIVASMDIEHPARGEFLLAMLGLGCDLLARAPPGLRKRHAKDAERVLSKARALREREEGEEMKARYEEVVRELSEVMH